MRHVHAGQAVTMTADAYGQDVLYHGVVVGQEAGTGSAFSLMPAQNATGNWIKVVQRVPVRIALEPAQLAQHPLRVGLSMEAEVDISNKEGKALADASRDAAQSHTQAFAMQDDAGDEAVKRVIAANSGRSVKTGKTVNTDVKALVSSSLVGGQAALPH